MSGHSKWSTIKRQKGVTDVKRGAVFTRVSNAVTLAAREGGDSLETNFKLRLAIDEAKRLNMPKENIRRAINRGVGKGGEGVKLEEIIYEGFGPGGIAVLIFVVTDSRQRSAQEIRSIFDRSGGTLSGPGSVSYLFSQFAQIDVRLKNDNGPDEMLLAAADAGAEDVEVFGDNALVYCEPSELEKVMKALEEKGMEIVGTQLSMKPKNTIKIEESDKAKKILDLMEKLDDLSDVQKVYANFDIPEKILQKEATP